MSVVRYAEYTNAQAIDPTIEIIGKDNGLFAKKITMPVIAQGANANVFVYRGSGKIKAIMSARLTSAAGLSKPDVVASPNTLTIADDGITINYAVAGAGTAAVAGDILYLVLVVGY